MRLSVFFRLGAAVCCVALILFWQSPISPDLNVEHSQALTGTYQCISNPSGKYSASGTHHLNGISFDDDFSPIFGIHSPTPCFRELDGHEVTVIYIEQLEAQKRLALQVEDKESGIIYGISAEKKLALYRREASDKSSIVLARALVSLFICYLIAFDEIRIRFTKKRL